MFYGSDIIGGEEGPSKLRESGSIDILKTNHTVYDLADLFLKNNEFSIVIGGDYSLSLGSISGSSKLF